MLSYVLYRQSRRRIGCRLFKVNHKQPISMMFHHSEKRPIIITCIKARQINLSLASWMHELY